MGSSGVGRVSVPTRVVVGALVASGAAVVIGAIATAAVVIAVARTVITPPRRWSEKVRILALGTGTVTLSRTTDTSLAGTYGLWFDGGGGHARVGPILSETDATVTRELIHVDFGDLAVGGRARIGAWVYLQPDDIGFPWSEVMVPTTAGPAPAWLIPAEGDRGSWVINVHGRGVRRAETLRAVEVFRRSGYTSLLVSYRNDGDAPASADGRYALGDTEWEDIDAAIVYAANHGATDVVLMGWSMGGATVLQAVTRSQAASVVSGIVLESPVVDWLTALRHQGRGLGVANPFRHGVFVLLTRKWGGRFTGQLQPIDLARLNFVARAADLSVPILILHSADDQRIPATASRLLAELRPDIVTYEEFPQAGHTRLWNHDPVRWESTIASWLSRRPAASGHTGR